MTDAISGELNTEFPLAIHIPGENLLQGVLW